MKYNYLPVPHPDFRPATQEPAALSSDQAPTRRDPMTQALQELGDSGHSLQSLLHEGSSGNTLASYRAALRYWSAWHDLRFGHALRLPVPVKVVLQTGELSRLA
ncbi:hypothetical protein [Achromobacter insolitus]|uniref:hypothetical protein n=1 Tax=Achromobacter insolitus TaxID=217204 RepID=UPI0007C3B932|nr:hypothetical protein [Achromobacter insolitus]OAD15778.1 hypothetical protein A3839_05235 [Achromobacter insolitus]